MSIPFRPQKSDTMQHFQHHLRKRIMHPHDHFAKRSLKEKQVYLDLIKAYVEPTLYERLDIDTIEVIDPHLEHSDLNALECDILYRCKIKVPGGENTCLLLVEHQSSAQKGMALRFLQYTTFLLEYYRDIKTGTLPQIYSFCLYHGDSSPYPYSPQLCDESGDAALMRDTLSYCFGLKDCTQTSIDTLKQHGCGALLEIFLKIARTKDNLKVIRQLADEGLLRKVYMNTRHDYLASAFVYAVEFEENEQSVDELIDIFIRTLPEEKRAIMTFREQLEQRGRYAAKLEDAKKMLMNGIEYAMVKEITGLSEDELAAL